MDNAPTAPPPPPPPPTATEARCDIDRLAASYKAEPTVANANAVLLAIMPKIVAQARTLGRRLPWGAGLDTDGLIAEGAMGALRSLPRWNPRLSRLETYLAPRIHGAMIDATRVADPLTRTDRHRRPEFRVVSEGDKSGSDAIPDPVSRESEPTATVAEADALAFILGHFDIDEQNAIRQHLVDGDTLRNVAAAGRRSESGWCLHFKKKLRPRLAAILRRELKTREGQK